MVVDIVTPFWFLQLSNLRSKLRLQETLFRISKTKVREHIATAEFDLVVARSRFAGLGISRFINHRFEAEFNTKQLGIL